MNAVKQQQTAPPRERKMQLSSVTKGKIELPDRILIFGIEGVGKSSWAADAPSPIFLPAEDGTAQLDVSRFPKPEIWTDVLDAVETLRTEKHEYATLVLDTLDAIEPLVWKHLCARDGKAGIEDYGYGKGYTAAVDEWRVFLAALERLRREREMHVIMIAHSVIRTFKSPDTEDFDRYELKLHAKAGGLLKEWCDSVLFAHYETYANKDKKTERWKGVSTGARVVSTQRTAAWDAKNRYSLPETLPLAYEDYAKAVRLRQPRAAADLRASIDVKLPQLTSDETRSRVAEFLKTVGEDAAELAKIDNRLTALLTEQKGA